MSFDIKKDAVKIGLHPNGRELAAMMPDGTIIPAVISINVHSEVKSLIKATITLIVNVDEIEKWDQVLQKEIVVQHTIKGDDLVEIINKTIASQKRTF
jgi:hypothetical protein